MNEIIRMVVVLSVISGFSAAALTLANIQLQPKIDQQTDFYVRGPGLEKLFQQPADKVLGNKIIVPTAEGGVPVFYTMQDDKVANLAIEATGKGGFGGDLQIMIGIDLLNSVQTGMEVVSHSETPGLGARIVEPGFRRQWQGLPIDQHIAVTADGGIIDSISGASTTSRAAANGTNSALDFLKANKEEILKLISQR